MSLTFTVSKEDFKDYFECPKKLALKLMGYKAREGHERPISTLPAFKIGISGEKLTEQVLEIIAELQAEKPLEEVKTFVEREKEEREIIRQLVDIGRKEGLQSYSVEKLGEKLVKLTIDKAFGKEIEEYLKAYREEILRRTSARFSALVGELYSKLPKIKSVYKPVLKNRDFCSIGYPDFQIDSEKGQILIEVKNWASLNSSLKQGKMDLLYYNSVLADKILSASTHSSEKLPQPSKSLLIIPRFGIIEEIDDKIPNHRETAVEIWKIKRAAIVEGKLPQVVPVSTICKRCSFKKYCQEGESLEKAKPLPLLYALAYQEAEKEIERVRTEGFRLPSGFLHAYFTLKEKAEKGNHEALRKLGLLETYRMQRIRILEEKEQQIVFRSLANEFEHWGGIKILRDYYLKISRVSNMLFPQREEKIREIIRVARKKWDI